MYNRLSHAASKHFLHNDFDGGQYSLSGCRDSCLVVS